MGGFIQSSAQISIQEPLCNNYVTKPVLHDEPYVRAIECDYKAFIDPISARRMGKILKRAIAVSVTALKASNVTMPDAVITGTGLGCIENTEKFLSAMTMEGEEFLQPAFFINSTHNTISSQVAIYLKCHGYNNTYSHRGISFESALMDAFMQFETGSAASALVGGDDEMTPGYFALLDKLNYWKKSAGGPGAMAGETAVAFVLSNEVSPVELSGVEILFKPTADEMNRRLTAMCERRGISIGDIDAIFVGRSGDVDGDRIYDAFCGKFFPDREQFTWKKLFGESFTSPAMGMYVADELLRSDRKPLLKHVLVYNHFQNKDHSLILLSKC